MIDAPALTDRPASLNAMLVRRKRPALLVPSASRALVVYEPKNAGSGFAADLRFFAICYLAGFIFFLIMLS